MTNRVAQDVAHETVMVLARHEHVILPTDRAPDDYVIVPTRPRAFFHNRKQEAALEVGQSNLFTVLAAVVAAVHCEIAAFGATDDFSMYLTRLGR